MSQWRRWQQPRWKKSWKCISEADASLAFELYGDKNIFVRVEAEVRVGGAGCMWMKGGCESRHVSGPFAHLCSGEAANTDVILGKVSV